MKLKSWFESLISPSSSSSSVYSISSSSSSSSFFLIMDLDCDFFSSSIWELASSLNEFSESFNIFVLTCLLDLKFLLSTFVSFLIPNNGLLNLFLKLNRLTLKLALRFLLSIFSNFLSLLIFLTEFLNKNFSLSFPEILSLLSLIL